VLNTLRLGLKYDATDDRTVLEHWFVTGVSGQFTGPVSWDRRQSRRRYLFTMGPRLETGIFV